VQHGTEEGYYTMFYASVVLDLLATAFYFKDRKKIAISCLLLEFLPLLLILQHYYCLCDNHAPAQIMLTILKPIMFLVFCVKCSMSAILCTPRLVYEAAKKFIPANRGAWAPRGLVIAYCLFCYLPEMGYFVLHIIYIPFLSLFAAGGL
jgi:hypothetical protein